ncbi:alpha/beta hydrolase [Acidihalobacter ferrooxydans]|uniref:Phospholipase/carboxylesterase/thioesterase domain-containing protein n=1 Tax=Acidihalobacter ferrooxydans TaxID=1765967 RepID=A0A1P8UD10_9GAMM|nr:hypothetical protein [Acidihalobacter ferrooxydans]APZ41751.1 hypothetical protein BW247_00430 [Acidihalobacter ferrooxydans]
MSNPESVLREYGPAPRHSLVWLHGLGADGHDFVPLFDQLERPPDLGLRVVLPHAPIRPVTINGGTPMRAWYDFRSLELGRGEAAEDIAESIALVHALLARERARLPAGGKLLLGGFSQGAVMTLVAGLRATPRPDALIVLSGYLWGDVCEPDSAPPVFQAHGADDPVIALPLGLAAHRALVAAGVEAHWRTYPMAHAVCPEEIDDLAHWLTSVLRGTR